MNNLKVLEPFYTVVKIALLNYYPDNTKISINNNEITFRLPTMYQGILRWSYGEDRSDIQYIVKSIKIALIIIQNSQLNLDKLLYYLFTGINKLTLCYVEDKKYKKKLQNLEKLIKSLFNKRKIIINTDYNKKLDNFYQKDLLLFLNNNFKIIEDLYKLNKNINIHNKEKLRKYYISIINKIILIKNKEYINHYFTISKTKNL